MEILFLDLGAADIHIRFFRSGLQPVLVGFDDVVRLNRTIDVYHGSASAATSSVGLINTLAGQVSGTAIVNDEYGNPVLSGVQLRMTQDNQSTTYLPANNRGRYTQNFAIYEAGRYLLELLHNGAVVQASDVVIRPGPPDAYRSVVEGSGLGNSRLNFGGCEYLAPPGGRLLAAGVPYALRIKLRDAWNNSCEDATTASWDTRFASHIDSALNVHGGSIDVVFVPRKVGDDLPFALSVDGSPLFATTASVVPGPPADMSISLSSTDARAGDYVNVTAHVVDSEGNPLSCAGLQKTLVFADRVGRQSTHSFYGTGQDISATWPEVPGFYSMSIKAADIEGTVPSLFVQPGAIDPVGSYLRVAESRSTDSIDLILVMVDRFNNSAPSLAQITNVTIIPPASIAVSVGAVDVLITVTNFTRGGEHLAYVSVNFEPISTFPLRFERTGSDAIPPPPRVVSYAALIAIGAACAACGLIFVAGCCGYERWRAVLRNSPRPRPFSLKRQLL